MKIFIALFFAFSMAVAGATTAQEDENILEEFADAETIMIAELDVAKTQMLPTSPFYFLKEIGRGVQRAFTFNAIAKIELELKIAGEKAAEAKRVAEQDPADEKAISRALHNYEQSQERLRARLESLRETSENPNIDRLLDQITERQIVHEKLLQELQGTYDAHKTLIGDIRTKVEGVMGAAAEKDTAGQFAQRLEKALEEMRGSAFKHLRSIEILDRLQESDEVPEDAKERIREVRGMFVERIGESAERFAEEGEDGSLRMKSIVERMPGDVLRRTAVLEELRGRTSAKTADALQDVRESLEERALNNRDFEEAARAQIAKTEEHIARVENRIGEFGDRVPQAVLSLLERAKENVERAKAALEEGNPREAFGLSRAAEAIVANIARIFESGIDVIQESPHLLDAIRDRIQEMPIPMRSNLPASSTRDAAVCTAEYAPVCGVNGQTYGNRCVAEQEHRVRVAYRGECRPIEPLRPEPLSQPTIEPSSAPPASSLDPTARAITLAADDYGFYPSSEIRVARGTNVTLTFNVTRENVYYAGLDFRSSKFITSRIDPGTSTTVKFTADESFDFQSYWPSSGVLKATGHVIVE